MQDIVIIMMCLSIGIYIVRFALKYAGIDLLCGIFSVCTLLLLLKDTTIPNDDVVLFAIPEILILMLTFIHLSMGRSKDGY